MANQIPNTSGNIHGKKGGKSKGKDPHAGKTHHKFNKHHGMAHAMGETEAYSSSESTGSGSHMDRYHCDGENTD